MLQTINCKGRLIDFNQPKVMGILNITPDSFYDGGIHTSMSHALRKTEAMLEEGATFIDVGAYSSRPGAYDITVDEELKRLIPVVTAIIERFPECNISIDTFRAQVAREAIHAGAALINDIAAGHLDKEMLPTIAELQVPYIMMHMRGTPQTMKSLVEYDDLVGDILFYFSERIAKARALGIHDLIVDPGFGFAKTLTQNFILLKRLKNFKVTALPLLVGFSRKSLIQKTLGVSSGDALNGTTVLNTLALRDGANILRVHDVKPAVEAVKLYLAARGE